MSHGPNIGGRLRLLQKAVGIDRFRLRGSNLEQKADVQTGGRAKLMRDQQGGGSPHDSVSSEEILGPLTEVERKAAPGVLHLKGDRTLLQAGPRIAVVGSRRASSVGLERARRITIELVKHGVTVVSGLALGIDTVAHRTAISQGGRTIAVLGTSLDRCAVGQNRELQRFIGEEHLLVSQFPVGERFHRSNFPRRNKTMALLSDATLIVEAAENSGTRHQGWEAIRLGRPVLFPTRFLAATEAPWPHQMADYGAFGFNANTLSLVLDELPHRATQPFFS